MKKTSSLLFGCVACIICITAVFFVPVTFAQETALEATKVPVMGEPGITLPGQPASFPAFQPYQPTGPAMPRINPAVLLKMRNDLSFELQNTQRTLGLIDPNDAELKKTLSEQQAELVKQLKDINAQLKAQGIPQEGEIGLQPGMPGMTMPKKNDTLMGSESERLQSASDPNLQIQQRPAPGSFPPGIPPMFGFQNPPAEQNPGSAVPNYTPPQPFDQDRAWANSPWVPQPSKELTDLKQTVESLRVEIGSLKETVKALETQIQLLNRNILLSQPK